MYELSYDFQTSNQIIAKYFQNLIANSSANLQQQVKNSQVINLRNDSNSLANCIANLEQYLYYNFEKSPQNFDYILNSIMNNVSIISVLPKNERGIYGKTEIGNKTIYINPDLPNSNYLTGEERTKLYMSHELGHVINNSWMQKTIEFLNKEIRSKNLSQSQAQLIYEGFSMLDEATTQNRAENFVYSLSSKNRPPLLNYTNQRLFNGQSYLSNFDFYGELQAPATMFAKTLRGIGKSNNDVSALNILSERAISPLFFNNILREYSRDGQMQAFAQELQYMGLLKKASYANFGYDDISYLNNSASYLNNLKSITSKMRDYREPIDFDL